MIVFLGDVMNALEHRGHASDIAPERDRTRPVSVN
jgi:hypothetical protein